MKGVVFQAWFKKKQKQNKTTWLTVSDNRGLSFFLNDKHLGLYPGEEYSWKQHYFQENI